MSYLISLSVLRHFLLRTVLPLVTQVDRGVMGGEMGGVEM